MVVTHEPRPRVLGSIDREIRPGIRPAWSKRVDKSNRRGWLILVVVGLLVLVAIIIVSANVESTDTLTVSDATQKLSQLCDAGPDFVNNQGSASAYGGIAALYCTVTGHLVDVYVFQYNVDVQNAVSAVSQGGQEGVVIGPNWIAEVGPALPGATSSRQTAEQIQDAFGGTIKAGRSP